MTDRIEIERTGNGLWRIRAFGGYDGFVQHTEVKTEDLPRFIAELAQYDGSDLKPGDRLYVEPKP